MQLSKKIDMLAQSFRKSRKARCTFGFLTLSWQFTAFQLFFFSFQHIHSPSICRGNANSFFFTKLLLKSNNVPSKSKQYWSLTRTSMIWNSPVENIALSIEGNIKSNTTSNKIGKINEETEIDYQSYFLLHVSGSWDYFIRNYKPVKRIYFWYEMKCSAWETAFTSIVDRMSTSLEPIKSIEIIC